MRSYRKFAAATLASALVLGGALAGCGGGGGNNNNNTGNSLSTSRSASVETVQSARSAIASLVSARRFGGGSAARSRKAHLSRQQGLQYDEEQGLYYSFTQTGETTYQINYYRDQAGTQGAGFVRYTANGQTGAVLEFDQQGGEEPQRGTLTITSTDSSGESGRVRGSITYSLTGNVLTFDLSYSQSGNTTGSLSSSDHGSTVQFTNLVIGTDDSLDADVTFTESNSSITGHITQDATGAGVFTLNNPEGSGSYVARYDANGAGTLTYPDGTVENISDYDTFSE